jgi:hypothetical protein
MFNMKFSKLLSRNIYTERFKRMFLGLNNIDLVKKIPTSDGEGLRREL